MDKKLKLICNLGMGINLYAVLGLMVEIQLLGHIQTYLGYIAFGAYLYLFGAPAAIVGIIGCLFESILVSGLVPIGLMFGQLVIGLICGFMLKRVCRYKRKSIKVLAIVALVTASLFLGIGFVKTIIECKLYSIPYEIKFAKNAVAAIADVIPMLLGIYVGKLVNRKRG